jgi:hypothetical protein
MLKQEEWTSLSIPKKLISYNSDKFSQEKNHEAFYDDEIKNYNNYEPT